MPSPPSQDHVRARWHPVPTVGRQGPRCFPGSSVVSVPQRHSPPQRASPAPQTHHLTCCRAWAPPQLACLLARRVSRALAAAGSFNPKSPVLGAGPASGGGGGRRCEAPVPAPGAGTNKRQLCRVSSLCTQRPDRPLGNSPSGPQGFPGCCHPLCPHWEGKRVRASLGIPITATVHAGVPEHPFVPARSCPCLGGVPG